MTPLSSPALDTVRANALYLLKEALESIRNQDAYEQTGRPYVEAAYFYRRVALCELLADARTDRFFVYLCKSAQARLSLLHQLALGQLTGAAVELQPLLTRWEAVVGTDITCHLELCQALHTRDSQRFNLALKDAITQRAAAFKAQKNDAGPKDAALTEAPVHVTGLALVRLAELRDMETLHEYPTLPRLARIPPGRTPPPADSWLHPGLAVPA